MKGHELMTFLQDLIVYFVVIMLLSLLTVVGTYLQDNLVFRQYETRFTPHGLVIKALDVMIVLFLLATVIMITVKIDYMNISSFASMFGSMSAEAFLSTISLIQNICDALAQICFVAWLIMILIYATPSGIGEFVFEHSLAKKED